MAHEIQERLKSFAAALESVKRDQNLSDVGKQKQIASITATRDAYRANALQSLTSEWQSVRKSYTRLDKERRAAEEQASKNWDYARLTYLESEVRGAIQAAQTNPLGGR